MAILITGVCGFIGSNLARHFLDNGERVFGVDNLSRGTIDNVRILLDDDKFSFTQLNICDYNLLFEKVNNYNFKYQISEVWHLAANSDIPQGIANSYVDLNDTYLTTFNILKLLKELNIKIISFSSTSAIYGNFGDRIITEDIGPLFPISNYGAMKLASEASISAAVEGFLDKAFIFRFPNVIGMPATHGVIFDFINKLIVSPNELEVLGNGTQQKTYLHVDELIEAMIFVRKNGHEKLNYYNIGADDEGASVKFIAEEVVKSFAPTAIIKYGNSDKGWIGDVPKFRYSIDKIKKLGWSPQLGSEESLKKAILQITNHYSN
jgi:UDP-glucose 4-epimerase